MRRPKEERKRYHKSGVLRPTLSQLDKSLASSNGSTDELVNVGLNIPERSDGERIAMSLSDATCNEDCDTIPGDKITGDGDRAMYTCGCNRGDSATA